MIKRHSKYDLEKIKDFKICGKSGTSAEFYSKENEIEFIAID